MKSVGTFPEDVAGISCTYLPIKASISIFMDVSDDAPLIWLRMQDQISLTLRSCSFSGCGRTPEYAHLTPQGGQYV